MRSAERAPAKPFLTPLLMSVGPMAKDPKQEKRARDLLRKVKREALALPDYDILEPKEPEFFKDIFPWEGAPRIPIDGVAFPPDLPQDICITDTTFRDGQQAREPYTVEQMVDLFKLLKKLGGAKGRITMSEFFLYTEKDIEAVKRCIAIADGMPEVTAWIRATPADVKLFAETSRRIEKETGGELRETGMLTSISDFHVFFKFKDKGRKAVIQGYLDLAEQVLKEGFALRCHFEDSTRADTFGVTVPFARGLMRLAEKYGERVVIRLPDTMGVGVPWVHASLPRSIPKLVWVLRNVAGVPADWIEFHGQQDFQLGIANATAAWMYGAGRNNCTLLGIGERAGNVPLEIMVFMYAGLKGSFDGMNTKAITEIAQYYQKKIGYGIPPYWPLVGKNFNITRAGVHADGLLKNVEMYLPFDTEKVLGIPPGVSVTSYSGAAGIVFWVNYYFRLQGASKLKKDSPGVDKMLAGVTKEFDGGRTTAYSDGEMAALVRKHMPHIWEKYRGQAVE